MNIKITAKDVEYSGDVIILNGLDENFCTITEEIIVPKNVRHSFRVTVKTKEKSKMAHRCKHFHRWVCCNKERMNPLSGTYNDCVGTNHCEEFKRDNKIEEEASAIDKEIKKLTDELHNTHVQLNRHKQFLKEFYSVVEADISREVFVKKIDSIASHFKFLIER